MARACDVGLLAAAASLAAALALLPAAPSRAGEIASEDQAALFRSLLPTVVNVTARHGADASASISAGTVVGSGFVIESDGLLVTNWHVVAGASDITVAFSDGSRLPATLASASRVADIALLRVQAGHALQPVHWGDSDAVEVGEPVVAMGNPLGMGLSASMGIVSALNRDIMASPYDDFIQTDAAINHGNSGGPLFDMRGEVIGIDAAIVSPTSGSAGLGFAIPERTARFVIDRLQRFGAVRPGWVGASVQEVTPDMAQALGMASPRGSIVTAVVPGGPAAQAGLRTGDVVLRFGSDAPSDKRALMRAVAVVPAGQAVPVAVLRGGQEQVLSVTVGDWPSSQWDALDAPARPAALHPAVPLDFGLSLAAVTDDSRARYGLQPGQAGVLVAGVAANTDAAQRGLAAGDVVLQVRDAAVASVAELLAQLDAARRDGRGFVMLLILPKVQDVPGPKWVALRTSADGAAVPVPESRAGK